MKFYKVRNTRTGLWSKGGMDATAGNGKAFSKIGKTWACAGHVRNHLAGLIYTARHFSDHEPTTILTDLEIVEYDIDEENPVNTTTNVTSAADFHLRSSATYSNPLLPSPSH